MRGRALVFTVVATLVAVSGGSGAYAAGDAEAGKAKSAPCVACHGTDGNSAAPIYPKIAGQNAAYLLHQLSAFKGGARNNPVMLPFVQNLSEQDMADLSAYYAGQKVSEGSTPESAVAAGAKLYRAGNAETGVPACMACHGPQGVGNPYAGWPALAGQHPDYIKTQLKAYAAGERSTDAAGMMRDVAKRLSSDEIEAISQYVSGLH